MLIKILLKCRAKYQILGLKVRKVRCILKVRKVRTLQLGWKSLARTSFELFSPYFGQKQEMNHPKWPVYHLYTLQYF